jgi:hypothetical protein
MTTQTYGAESADPRRDQGFTTSEPAPDNKRKLSRTPYVWAILSVWGYAAFALSQNGVFQSTAATPPIAVAIAALGPGLIFLSVYSVYAPLRRWVDGLDLSEIIALQAWRIIGFAFLAVWGLGELPAVFALPASIGDMTVGLAAPVVALTVERRSKGWRISAYGLIAAGIFDFIIAFATGILSRQGGALDFNGHVASSLLGVAPLSLFPAFIVPAFFILHIIALIKLRRA